MGARDRLDREGVVARGRAQSRRRGHPVRVAAGDGAAAKEGAIRERRCRLLQRRQPRICLLVGRKAAVQPVLLALELMDLPPLDLHQFLDQLVR